MFRLCVAFILTVEVLSLALLPLFVSETVILLLAPLIPLTVVLAFVLYPRFGTVSYRVWRLTPERIIAQKPQESPEETDPVSLSRSIVERAAEIRRAMLDAPSEVQIEICALGYRACVNDMITLTHRINEELPNAGFIRRFFLNRIRKKATDALSETREALPPGALRATRQEQQ